MRNITEELALWLREWVKPDIYRFVLPCLQHMRRLFMHHLLSTTPTIHEI